MSLGELVEHSKQVPGRQRLKGWPDGMDAGSRQREHECELCREASRSLQLHRELVCANA